MIMLLILLILIAVRFTGSQNLDVSVLDNLNGVVKGTTYVLLGGTGNIKSWGKENPNEDKPFPCQPSPPFRSKERPTSVHEVRPGDIDVISALGDSITAGLGAAATLGLHIVVENRGLSWCMGGQETWREFLTLPNILKEFNPNLVGYSTGDSAVIHRESQFNLAEGGAMSRDMPPSAAVLVKRIKADKRVDFEKDWKMVTIMIGFNDICTDSCYFSNPFVIVENHRKNLMKTLDYLRDFLPRTIVSVTVHPNTLLLYKYFRKSLYCNVVHLIGCTCIYGIGKEKRRAMLATLMDQWVQVEEEVSMDARYRNKDDFAVVFQPFWGNMTFPQVMTPRGMVADLSIVSPDCAHFNPKGYGRAAFALWKNLLEPIGRKTTDWSETMDDFPCPSDNSPYIFTWKNSGDTANNKQF